MKVVDRLKQTTAATSTAVVTLSTAVTGFRTVAQAIADGDLAVGDKVQMGVQSGASWELALYLVDSATQLTRQEVLSSSAGGAAVTFPAGSKEIFSTASADFLNGIDIATLAVVAPLDAHALPILDKATGLMYLATLGSIRTLFGGSSSVDSAIPTAPTNLASSSVTQSTYTITFTPGTDNVAVQRSEWSLDGSTWTPVTGGATGNTFGVSGRVAGSTDTVRVRTVDTSGNVSAAATLSVTLAAASGDTQEPTWLAGSLATTSVTSSGYVMNWPSATDNVGVTAVESSIDGGATWMTHAANVTTRTVTGRPASTTDALRVRAKDAASNVSNVLSASVTTSAAAATAYTITGYNGNAVKSSIDATTGTLYGSIRRVPTGTTTQTTLNNYWNVNATSGGAQPASAKSGWGTSSTVPPDEITLGQNANGASSINGLLPMDPGAAFYNNSGLVVPVGFTGQMHFWVKPSDGAAQLVGSATITGA